MADGGLVVVPRHALDLLASAAIDLERRAQVTDPRLREAWAEFMVLARPVGPERPYLSMREAAAALGVSERTVRRRVRSGELPCRREGRRVLIPASGVGLR